MENQEQQKPLIYGILGACLGSLIGGASYIVLSIISEMIGFSAGIYSVLSSMVFAYCTLRFYRKFGGSRGTVGLLICSAAILVLGFVAYSMDWVLTYVLLGIPFATSFEVVFKFAIKNWDFWKNLLLLYAFIAACIWSLLFSAKKARRED